MDTVITFNDLADGAKVESQFLEQGLLFKNANYYSSGLPVVKKLEDGTKTLSIATSGEFGTSAVLCNFRLPHSKVIFMTRNLKDETVKVILKVYDGAMNFLQEIETEVSKFDGLSMALEVSREQDDIGNIIVVSPPFTAKIAIDAIIYDEEASSVVPTFKIARKDSSFPVGLRPLQSIEEMIEITRSWGSSGKIAFEIENLPRGMIASFLPNPSDGNMVTLKLTANYDAELCNNKPAIIKGIPNSASAGIEIKTLEIPITVVPNYSLLPLDIDVFPCTEIYSELTAYIPQAGFDNPEPGFIPHSFRGKIELSLFSFGGSPLPDGVELNFTPSYLVFDEKVIVKSIVRVKARPGSLGKKIQVAVLATHPDYPSSYTIINLNPAAGRIDSFTPNEGQTPIALQPGSEVILEGVGLCNLTPPLKVQFGNSYAEATVIGIDGRRASVTVPRLATDGPLTLVSASGTNKTLGNFKVNSFRNIHGFPFKNFDMTAVTFEDLTEAFGKDQTHFSAIIDPCRDATAGFAHCPLVSISTVPNPLAFVMLPIINANITAHCFGMSLISERMLKNEVPYNQFSPFTARNAFQLSDRTGPWEVLKHYLKIQSLTQCSSEFLSYWLNNASNTLPSVDAFRNQVPSIKSAITADLLRGNYPFITMRKGGEGHVVLAYDIENGSEENIAFYICVYDSNQPFTDYRDFSDPQKPIKNENTDADEHKKHEKDNGRIIIYADGRWEFLGFNPKWGSYLDGSLVVVPYNAVPKKPSLPTSLDGVAAFVFGSAKTEQISNTKNQKLFGDDGSFNSDPTTRLEGVIPFAFPNGDSKLSEAFIMKPGVYSQRISGTVGSYSNMIVGKDFALQIQNVIANNSTDEIYVDPLSSGFAFKPEDDIKQLNATLITTDKDKSIKTVIISTTASKNKTAKVEFSSDKQNVIYKNEGNTTSFGLHLGWAGTTGLPEMFTSDLLEINAEETFVLYPNWNNLSEGEVSADIISKNGKVQKKKLKNKAQYPFEIKVNDIIIEDESEAGKNFRIDFEPSRLDLIGSVILTWIVLQGQKPIGRHIEKIEENHLKDGKQSHNWSFFAEESGEYSISATVTAISKTLPPFTLKRTRTKMFNIKKDAAQIVISQVLADPKGRDIENEYVLLKNISDRNIILSGWSIRDLARHQYVIPEFTLSAGSELRIWTKAGANDQSDLFMGRKSAIWNNKGDVAILLNEKNVEVARLSYLPHKM